MRKLLKGNEAIVLGSLAAGCDACFGCPIVPASEIMDLAALYYLPLGKIFIQAESEAAAISMLYGGSASGLRVFTASSGSGISLMQDGISCAAGAELPMVLVDVMRAGPGAGNCGAEQSGYFQAVKGGGQGSYHLIVLVPNSVQEIYQMSIDAFDLADRYRIPVLILLDADLARMAEPVEINEEIAAKKIEKPWKLDTDPGSNEIWITTVCPDFDEMENHLLRLEEKYREIADHEAKADLYRTDDAEILLSGYGITSRILRSAVDLLRTRGIRAGLIRPKTVWPFPEKDFQNILERLGKDLPVLAVEMSSGQYAEDVKRSIPGANVSFLARRGGNLPTEEEIMEKVQKILNRELSE
ncbi:MAG: 3-methyl-2-oxobutanoate dehydrogenase subunit VorB [Planctomycetia bacterium]|nr:3-methyl-2-oxobutanoate dehydrogenase subunit VorB [Planctomycetia bacterium]